MLVLCGDTPLLRAETLRRFVDFHKQSGGVASVLTAEMADATGYGRIVRAADGTLAAIVEQKSASPEQLALHEVNTGIYCFQSAEVFPALARVKPDAVTQEYYLTDVVGLLAAQGRKVAACRAPEASEVIGINDRAELARADALLRARKAQELMQSGVTILRPESVSIDPDVVVGADTVIEPGVCLRGRTRVGGSCQIGAYSVLTDSELSERVTVRPSCVITVCQALSPIRSAKASNTRRVRLIAFLSHCEIKVTIMALLAPSLP